jgi:hypothetical protein
MLSDSKLVNVVVILGYLLKVLSDSLSTRDIHKGYMALCVQTALLVTIMYGIETGFRSGVYG